MINSRFVFLLLIGLSVLTLSCSVNNIQNSDSTSPLVHPELLIDRDSLIDVVEQMDNFIAVDYTTEQIKNRENDESYKDYGIVVKKYVQNELKQEVDTFQTLKHTDESRWLLVTTDVGRVYKIQLVKQNNIWLVNAYGELRWKTYPIK
ncbi:MAG: hypothetical protein H0Z34_16850 [Brevibacillus sp.]|nr:hypothetical protein [Brevibacillus sp.]